MVKFNQCDYCMETIQRESKLLNLKTRYSYRVFGLQTLSTNPAVAIILRPGLPQPKKLSAFLTRNGIYAKCVRSKNATANSALDIKIGLRRDLRDKTNLCAACLQTVIYYLEGRLSLPKGYTLPPVEGIIPPPPPEGSAASAKPPDGTVRRFEGRCVVSDGWYWFCANDAWVRNQPVQGGFLDTIQW